MAGSFRIAEGYVEVTADESSYDTSMERLKSTKHTVKVGVGLDEGDVLARLKELSNDRFLKIDIKMSTTTALADLKKLTKDRSVKILIDVDTRVAADELANLTRTRTAKVKIDLDQTALASFTDGTRTIDVLAEINQVAYDRAVAKLDKLTADRNMIIRPSVDTRVAADEIRNLTRRQRVNIGIDIDTRVAADSLANLTRTRTARINAEARTAEARLRLDALARDRTMNVDVNVRSSGLSALTSLGGSSGGLGILSSRIAQIAAAAIGALPTVASLGSSLIQMGPAAALAVPAVLSLATAFAAIKIGTSGIGDAFKAAFAPAAQGASTALSATKAVESAQRSLAKAVQAEKDAEVNAAAARVKAARDVKDAQQNLKNTVSDVADSNRRAAESVAQAERDLTQAQKAATQAQEDLTQARKDAATELVDLNNQLEDAQLSQRQDVLNLADAEAQLAKDKAAGAAVSAAQMAQDQLDYDQALQALEEQQIETQRLQDQTDAANKAGVEGSATVAAAKQTVADATQTTADKEQALNDQQIAAARTQVDGAQQIAKAQRDLSDAQAAQTKAATDGARAVADAQEAITQAAQALAEAQQSAALKTGTLSQALAKLSPNAQAFVAAVVAQRAAWTALRLDVQDRLFSGLAGTFTTMANASLPALRTGLVGTAGVLNTMAKNAMSAVTNLAKTGTLKQMFAGLNAGLRPLARFPGQFITALAQISVAASPAFKRLTTAAGNGADSISKKIGAAFSSGGMTDAINGALDIAKQFGHLLGDIFGTVGNVMKAAAAGGGDALGTLGAVFSELRKVTAMPEVQAALTSIFTAINSIAKLLAGTLGVAIQALLPVFAALAPVVTQVVGILGPVLATLAKTLGVALMPIATALGPVLVVAAQAIGSLVTAFLPLLPVIGQMIAALGPVLTPILGIIGDLFTALAPVLAQLGKSLLPPFLKLTSTLAGVFKELSPVLGVALEQLGTNGLVPIVAALGMVIGDLVSAYADQFIDMFKLLLPVIPVLIPVVVQLAQSIAQILLSIAPLLPKIMLLTAQLITQLLPAIIPLLPVIADLVTALLILATGTITKVVMPILSGLIGFMGGLLNKLQPAIDAVKTVTKAIADAFQWLYDVLIGHSIIPDMVNGIIGWFTGLWTKTKALFSNLMRDVVNIWNSLWTTVRNAWNHFWSGLSSAINSARNWIGTAFSGIRTTVTNTWNSLWNGVSSKFTSVIGGIRTGISNFASSTKNAFSTLRDSLGTIWNGIREKIASPVRFVVGTVYNNGIRKMWDTIASKVGLPQLPSIKLGFAKGGPVPGVGTGDIVPAMLTPGERVLSVPQVAHLGGHRGIDAILGKDHPTGTGGNPTRAQDRKMQQPVQKFGIGGIVDTVTGAVSGSVSWVKDLVVGGLQAAARKAISSLVQPLINRIPSGGTGDLMKGLSGKALDGILGKFGKEDDKAVGGPAVQKALAWAKGQDGKPYQWGGNGNPSWDCSGLMSAIESVIRGESPHRRWATGSFSGSTAPPGWVRNLVSPFMIGVTNAGVGHTAGTLGGVNVESQGTLGVLAGSRARGYNDPLFQNRYGFEPATKFDKGGLLAPGATMVANGTGRPERVLNADQTAMVDRLLTSVGSSTGGPNVTVNMTLNSMTIPSQAEMRRFATQAAEEMKEALRNLDNSRRR